MKRTCKICRGEINVIPFYLKVKKQKYCSSECYHISRRGVPLLKKRNGIIKKCQVCKKERYWRPSELKRTLGAGSACSNECKWKLPIYKENAKVMAKERIGKPCHSEEWKEHLRKKYTGENNPAKRPEVREKIRAFRATQIFPIKQSSIETKIQSFLKELRIEFFAHHNFNEIKHKYQCDIWIPSMNLVIECDGDYWHSYPTGTEIDHVRTKELIEKGFKVLRLWERDIKVMDLETFKRRLYK